MGSVYIERRALAKGVSLSWDIAHHLYTRQLDGKVLIITDRPEVLLASVRKQWMKVIQGLELERAKTLGSRRVAELERHIAKMKVVKFSAKVQLNEADVWFSTYEGQSIGKPPIKFQTAYLVLKKEDISQQIKQVNYHGLLVVYA